MIPPTHPPSKASGPAHQPHPLDLYRLAVQHPQAETQFLRRAYEHHHRHAGPLRPAPTRLREDFGGTGEIAAAWVALNPEHQAMSVERDAETCRFADRRHVALLHERPGDLLLVQADVAELQRPRVDLIAAMNFSLLVYHDRATLRQYFRRCRAGLRSGGVLAFDLFGGPGAMRCGEQRVPIDPPQDEPVPEFTYRWQQRDFDAKSGRIDCRIHFDLLDGITLRDAFTYDWRLWTLPELIGLLGAAGFADVTVWCDTYVPDTGQSDGIYEPVDRLPAREDWVVYVTAKRPPGWW